MVVLCAVLGAMRQNGDRFGDGRSVRRGRAASALVLLGSRSLAAWNARGRIAAGMFALVMSFAPVLSGILIAGGSPASAGATTRCFTLCPSCWQSFASKTLPAAAGCLPCAVHPFAAGAFLQVGQLTRAIHRLTCGDWNADHPRGHPPRCKR